MGFCTIAFCLANLYVTGEISQPVQEYKNYEGAAWCTDHWCSGPIGELTIGMLVPISPEVTVTYGVTHESYIMESDRGQERFFFSFTWRPLWNR